MANKIKVQEQEAIKNFVALGWAIRKIARELGVSRNTVRSYVRRLKHEVPEVLTERIVSSACFNSGGIVDSDERDPPPAPDPDGRSAQTDPLSTPGNKGRKSLCLEYAQAILSKVETGLSAQRIYQDLKDENGFNGSYQSVKRYVHKLRKIDPKLVYRIEVAPAEEVQVDFGTGPTLITPEGKRARTWVFRIVLSHSRKAYSEAVRRQDTETFLRCLENAFRHFGGVSLTVNLDNLKAAVLKFDWADPELNPKLIDFARHYSTTILPCLPRTPEHKGKVESSIKYVKENALAGRKFESIAAVNQFLIQWEKTVADLRIHGTTKRQVPRKASCTLCPLLCSPSFTKAPGAFTATVTWRSRNPITTFRPNTWDTRYGFDTTGAKFGFSPGTSRGLSGKSRCIGDWNRASSPMPSESVAAGELSKPTWNTGWDGPAIWVPAVSDGLRLWRRTAALKPFAH